MPTTKLPPVSLSKLWMLTAQAERLGVRYTYGGKARGLDSTLSEIALHGIDCSGWMRWFLYQGSGGKWPSTFPDGSQNQRAWFEAMAREGASHEIKNYSDEAMFMTNRRLMMNYIRPGYHGCGEVGHTFMTAAHGGSMWTMESWGGHGPGSRIWSTPVLQREWYSGFEIPTVP